MGQHPLSAGTRVVHIDQEWARALPGGTAEIIDVKGPNPDGSFEYEVRTTEDFSRRPGPDNPETRQVWWSSGAVRVARPASCWVPPTS